MLIGEPPPTQADLHFRVLGFPVRVHPFFWIATLLLALGGRADKGGDPLDVLIWVAVVFVSILIHELGHAAMQRTYGGHPWITLYSFGGLASCNDCDRSSARQIIISLAGPVAGFLLATLIILGLQLTGHSFGFVSLPERMDLAAKGVERALIQPLGLFAVYFEPVGSPVLNHVIAKLLEVNILWGIMNLLPVYPLDGGQIARELFSLGNPRAGIIQSLQLSIGTAILLALYALYNDSLYLCLMFGYLAYASFQTLRMYRDHWR
jgi:Zn-dependent protease